MGRVGYWLVPLQDFVDMEAVLHGFDNEAAGSICEDPVELSTWEVLTELCVGEIHS